MKRRGILMIPGPVEVNSEVLEVMGRPLVPHYEAEFAQIHANVASLWIWGTGVVASPGR